MKAYKKRLVSKREMMWRVFYQQMVIMQLLSETDLEKRKKVNPVLGLYYHYDTMCKWNQALNKLKKWRLSDHSISGN